MKLNIANPSTGAQLKVDIEDPKKLRAFMDKRISNEVEGDVLGDEWKGYMFKIMGGNDKEGFPMMQGVMLASRVRLLLDKNSKCYRARRTGERKRKSIRGCIVGPDISVLHLTVIKKGAEDVPGLTDKVIPRRLGPKRASKIRKLFNLSKQDDVRNYVIRRELEKKDKKDKPRTKAPKIQRLVTPAMLQRKRARKAVKRAATIKTKAEQAEYAKLLAQRNKERRQALLSKRRSLSQKDSKKEATPAAKDAPKKDAAKKDAKKPAAAKAPANAAAGKAKPAATKKPAEKKSAAKPAAKKAATPAKKTAKK